MGIPDQQPQSGIRCSIVIKGKFVIFKPDDRCKKVGKVGGPLPTDYPNSHLHLSNSLFGQIWLSLFGYQVSS
jgi:hypothetical protein